MCIARALGDLSALCIGVIPSPETVNHEICPEDEYLILASDGVFEFIDNDEAVQIVHTLCKAGKSAEDACRMLIAKAAMCWRHYEGDYRDDITAIVVKLQPVVRMLEQEQQEQQQQERTASDGAKADVAPAS